MPDTGILIDENHIIEAIIATGEYHLVIPNNQIPKDIDSIVDSIINQITPKGIICFNAEVTDEDNHHIFLYDARRIKVFRGYPETKPNDYFAHMESPYYEIIAEGFSGDKKMTIFRQKVTATN